jgi:hypothetical protein
LVDIIVSSITEVVLIIIFVVLTLGCGFGFIKVLLVERSDPVGPDFWVIDLSDGVRGKRAKAHRQATGVEAWSSQSGVHKLLGRDIHRVTVFPHVLVLGGRRWRGDLEALAIILLKSQVGQLG